jgi:hypothetical protein
MTKFIFKAIFLVIAFFLLMFAATKCFDYVNPWIGIIIGALDILGAVFILSKIIENAVKNSIP